MGSRVCDECYASHVQHFIRKLLLMSVIRDPLKCISFIKVLHS